MEVDPLLSASKCRLSLKNPSSWHFGKYTGSNFKINNVLDLGSSTDERLIGAIIFGGAFPEKPTTGREDGLASLWWLESSTSKYIRS